MRKKQDGVWLADPGLVHWTEKDVLFLMSQAPYTEKRRARICAHREHDRAHQMLIAFALGSKNEMHSHALPESLFVLRGFLEVEIAGAEPITLKPGEYLRIPAGVQHKPTPLTDCVILETAEK